MEKKELDINPTVVVNDLLDVYPQLEDVLIGIAPPFKKLKNPFLRKTVAKVATIKHISAVGGVPLDELIAKLRDAVGQPPINQSFNDEEYFTDKPEWFSPEKVTLSVDEAKQENKDEMTLVAIMREATDVKPGEIIELTTTFLPAPGIDKLKGKGYSAWVKKEEGGIIKSYFLKPSD